MKGVKSLRGWFVAIALLEKRKNAIASYFVLFFLRLKATPNHAVVIEPRIVSGISDSGTRQE
jgi:hypothetical protein